MHELTQVARVSLVLAPDLLAESRPRWDRAPHPRFGIDLGRESFAIPARPSADTSQYCATQAMDEAYTKHDARFVPAAG